MWGCGVSRSGRWHGEMRLAHPSCGERGPVARNSGGQRTAVSGRDGGELCSGQAQCGSQAPSARPRAPQPGWSPAVWLSMGKLLTVRCGPGLGLDLERGEQASRSLISLQRQQKPSSWRRGTHFVQLLPGDWVLSPRPPALRPHPHPIAAARARAPAGVHGLDLSLLLSSASRPSPLPEGRLPLPWLPLFPTRWDHAGLGCSAGWPLGLPLDEPTPRSPSWAQAALGAGGPAPSPSGNLVASDLPTALGRSHHF